MLGHLLGDVGDMVQPTQSVINDCSQQLVVWRSPDPFLSGYCTITGWKGSGSLLKFNCSMTVRSRTRCESNTSLMWYYSCHKRVSENGGECLCERRPYYRNSACGSSQSRVPRSKARADVSHLRIHQRS